ncbi:MAG: hypothetical protein R3C03_03110 [Pirellulaceae bacterium]
MNENAFEPTIHGVENTKRRAPYIKNFFWKLLGLSVIVVLLVGMMLPSVRRVSEGAHRTECFNDIRQLTLAAHDYYDNSGDEVTVDQLDSQANDESSSSRSLQQWKILAGLLAGGAGLALLISASRTNRKLEKKPSCDETMN